MEEEQDKIDPNYLKGFNEGYMLAHHNPDLIRKLASIHSDMSRVVGFRDGLEQFQTEQMHIQQIGEPEPDQQNQRGPGQTDVFEQLYRQQEDSDQRPPLSTTSQQTSDDDDLFLRLKKRQEQGYKGLDIEP